MRKRRKRDQGRPYIRKKQSLFSGKKAIFKKKKVYFGERIKKIQRGNGIFRTILTTALPLVGEIVKAFK